MLWANGRLTVFHGTTLKSANNMLAPGSIKPGAGRPRLDFGKGFYVTTTLKSAIDRANSKSRIAATTGGHSASRTAAVVQFDIDRDLLAMEEDLVFVVHNSFSEYWNFIFYNRLGHSPHRPALAANYAVVYGPIVCIRERLSFQNRTRFASLRSRPRTFWRMRLS